jgi:hypothetical protein
MQLNNERTIFFVESTGVCFSRLILPRGAYSSIHPILTPMEGYTKTNKIKDPKQLNFF